ncbi:stage V sporulation protein D [Paenibacillus sp. MY03]|uniref:penicillin-binding transpeptidase domain-containing protein n=1 Tax=Paenibacillus sp. MY03 TaxID=302980 RepID=UPI000B3C9E06|nr:penicillin-binding transpeptidase domain-containing protein [Paenibacillus sp. MY03]OUS76837.1 stage V sporulation protein D [Paenibacillus sp. MY03]
MGKRIKLRTLFFGGIMTLLFFVLIGRIYMVQVVDGAMWYEEAKKRWSAADTMKAKRGEITDRDGNVLAMDTIAYNVSVDPQIINDADIAEEVIDGLHETLGIDKDELTKQVTAQKEDGTFYRSRELRKGGWLIDKPVADGVAAFRDELKGKLREDGKKLDTGIYMVETHKRFYPRNFLASQLVGYVSLDGENKTGVEAYFDDQLQGADGFIRYEKDGKRVQLSKGEVDFQAPKDGNNIKLTIDSDIQQYVVEALRDIVKKYSPKSATAIAADPDTMEILAMANMPEFDPNEYAKYDYANFYNHAVGSLYEPGSTFKIATLAAAVEEGVFNPDEIYQSGSIVVPGDPRPIREHNRRGWGKISFLDGLKYSSNVAFVKLGFEKLGGEKLRDYFTRFGFGQKTGIELTNELAGKIDLLGNRDIASASFGQGRVQVTAIQQVAAVAAVANGGKLMEPHIVKSITDPSTNTTTVTDPKFVRQVISEQTSKQVGEYLEQVVSDQDKGTGKNAYIEGYRVAGKTGTAQKVINGKYSDNKFMVSFIGYAPVENPKIVLYIMVDEPNNPLAGGGSVAAPAFREIVLKSLKKMGIAPDYNIESDEESDNKEAKIAVPKVQDLSVAQAKAELQGKGLSFEVVGGGDKVLKQIPAASSLIYPAQKVYIVTEKKDQLAVPDLTGVSLRDALELTSLIGARLVTEGTGYVVSQQVVEENGGRLVKVQLVPPEGAEGYDEALSASGGGGEESDTGEEGGESQSDDESDAGESGGSEDSTDADIEPPVGMQGGEN